MSTCSVCTDVVFAYLSRRRNCAPFRVPHSGALLCTVCHSGLYIVHSRDLQVGPPSCTRLVQPHLNFTRLDSRHLSFSLPIRVHATNRDNHHHHQHPHSTLGTALHSCSRLIASPHFCHIPLPCHRPIRNSSESYVVSSIGSGIGKPRWSILIGLIVHRL